MNIIQLIEKVGMDNVQVQTVAHSFTGGRMRKHGAEITLCITQQLFTSMAKEATGIEGTHVGLILWIPRDRLREGAP